MFRRSVAASAAGPANGATAPVCPGNGSVRCAAARGDGRPRTPIITK